MLIKQRKINIQIKTSIPTNIPKGKFVIVDHSVTSQAIGYINELASSKQALHFLFKSLKTSMKEIQTQIGLDVKQSILFPLNRSDGGLIDNSNTRRCRLY